MKKKIKLTLSEYLALTWIVFNKGAITNIDNTFKVKILKDKLNSLKNKKVIDFTKMNIKRVFKSSFGKLYDIILEDLKYDFEVVYVSNREAILYIPNEDE